MCVSVACVGMSCICECDEDLGESGFIGEEGLKFAEGEVCWL